MDLTIIKKLREYTSLGISDCKKALEESGGDFHKALQILKDKGVKLVEKRKERVAAQGLIDSYIHFGGNLGALVEVNCETDFVAKTEGFRKFVKDVAMQVAATSPKYIKREDIPEEVLNQLVDVEEYIKENCLLEQIFIKDNKITIRDYLQKIISQTGENVVIRRFVRFSLGEK